MWFYLLNIGCCWWKTSSSYRIIITIRIIVWPWLRCGFSVFCFNYVSSCDADRYNLFDICYYFFWSSYLLYRIMGRISCSCFKNSCRIYRCYWNNIIPTWWYDIGSFNRWNDCINLIKAFTSIYSISRTIRVKALWGNNALCLC